MYLGFFRNKLITLLFVHMVKSSMISVTFLVVLISIKEALSSCPMQSESFVSLPHRHWFPLIRRVDNAFDSTLTSCLFRCSQNPDCDAARYADHLCEETYFSSCYHHNTSRDFSTYYMKENLTFTCQPKDILPYCQHIQDLYVDAPSGVYNISVNGAFMEVYCDLESFGGGWTGILRRYNGEVNFDRTWSEMKYFAGNGHREYWIGLEALHHLTNTGGVGSWEVLVNFTTHTVPGWARYSSFWIESATTKYKLHVTGYYNSSTAGDSFAYHDTMYFSTKDNDNDLDSGDCSFKFKGPGWYRLCHRVHMFGPYKYTPSNAGVTGTMADFLCWNRHPDGKIGIYNALKDMTIFIRRK